MKYYVVDAFASELFSGNPAGVCILDEDLSPQMMQKIAAENNLAETAFLKKQNELYVLRWFTPECEMDLCGHATLATAYVVMNYYETEKERICFETRSGELTVTRQDNDYIMDFPSRMPVPCEVPERLEEALGCRIVETYQSRDLVVVVSSQQEVEKLHVDMELLKQIFNHPAAGVIITSVGREVDFVSRFFAPSCGIPEDPVTGSAHATLIPFWAERLKKTRMTARQLSKRGGELSCENLDSRVLIGGKAVCYLDGEIKIN